MEPVDRVHVQAGFEQRQFPHLDFGPKQIVGRIVRLTDIFRQDFERTTSALGINPTEVGILTVLRAQGAPYALTPSAINQLRFTTASSGGLTNMIHGLEKRDLVERTPDPNDRRGVLIRLTRQALALIDGIVEARVAKEHSWLAALDSKERATLQGLLKKLLVSLEPVTLAPATTRQKGAARATAGRGRARSVSGR